MIRSTVSFIADVLLGRVPLYVALGVPVFGVAFFLVYGTDLLVAVGLSRNTAGNIAAAVAIIGSIAGLGAFGYYGIDW